LHFGLRTGFSTSTLFHTAFGRFFSARLSIHSLFIYTFEKDLNP